MSKPDTNQASEDALEKLIEERVKIASTETKSGDEVVHIAWLADGIDLWHRSNGEFGHSPAKARRYIISSVTRLIRTEKLKLLDEVIHQSTVNLKSASAVAGWAELRKEQLEAEL